MNFKIFGKHVKVGETFFKYSHSNLIHVINKYFPNAVSSIVSLSKKNKIFYIIIVLHITKKMEFTAQSSGETAKLAFDSLKNSLNNLGVIKKN